MIALDTNVLARAIAAEIDADEMIKGSRLPWRYLKPVWPEN